MRASYIPDLQILNQYRLGGDALHHLVNVVRVEAGEDLLLLNGKGLTVTCRIESVSKREMILSKLFEKFIEPKYLFDIALGIPKREALELCLKQSTELGLRRLYLIRADYSQMKIPELERMQKLLISGLEQSNAPYMPELIETDWNAIDWNQYSHKFLMDSQNEDSSGPAAKIAGASLLIVGPEGGFSPSELEKIKNQPGMTSLRLPTPIMRTPTALATGVGLLLQRLMD